MFELRRLRMLHELALRGTLASVAEALSYAPSTISQQLAQLEQEAGVALLAPDGRRVRLTEQGRLLAAHAAEALDADERVRGELETLRVGGAPVVRVAVMQTAASALVPHALSLLAERTPALQVEVAELPPEEGLFELTARRYDLVVAEQYPGHTRAHAAGHVRSPLGRDPIRLAQPPGRPPARLAELADRAWVMEPRGTAAREWAVQQCRAAGFEPRVPFELADLGAHVGLIAAGHAVGMLPDLVFAPTLGIRPSALTLTALEGSPAREVFVAMRRSSDARPSVAATAQALTDAFAERTGA
ncbi:LysR family transcriptional regulator [uncultured Microbacterium sp.]|uniref:LysR family transcriptional regulator n=1 Tax=uncultured Microbacterium sp. TaxID=191216 RepID=UPI0025DBB84E|nr:LysR family transcriptional regulator [uncultured Microbacterium sp.]